MRYLILGSTGFIGSNLVNALGRVAGNKIKIFNRAKAHADLSNNVYFNNDNFEVITGDFKPDYDFVKLTENIDIVYHLISTTNPSLSNKDMCKEVEDNVITTIKLLDACVQNKIKKIIFISSGGTVYGKNYGVPFKESDETYPICSYGIQKLAIEKYLNLYYYLYGLDYGIVRLSNPYGPYQQPNSGLGAITTFTYRVIFDEPIQIYGDGSAVRDYIYIDDAIQGILNITSYDGKYKLFNLGCGIGYSLIEVIEKIEIVLGKKAIINFMEDRKADVKYSALDISRYNSTFRNINRTSLCDGIIKLANYLIERYPSNTTAYKEAAITNYGGFNVKQR